MFTQLPLDPKRAAAWKAGTKGCRIITCFTILSRHRPEVVSKNPIEVETVTAAQLRRLWPRVSVSQSKVNLNVVPVVRYGGQGVTVYAFLDCGCNASFCHGKQREILQATGRPKFLTVNALTDSRKLNSVAIKVSVRAVDGSEWISLEELGDRRNIGKTEHSTFEKSS